MQSAPLEFHGRSATIGPALVKLSHSLEKLPVPQEAWMKQQLKMRTDAHFHVYNIEMTGAESENRFSVDLMAALHAALDAVQTSQESLGNPPAAIITSSKDAKIYSNGLKLEHAGKFGKLYMRAFASLLRRFLGDDIPADDIDETVDGKAGQIRKGVIVPTVACIQGHAFAGGFLLAMVHDYRVMRSDKGWVCMNEIDMPAPMPGGLLGVVRSKLSPQTLRAVMMQGYRFTGNEALAHGMVDALGVDSNDAWTQAMAVAGKWAPKASAGIVYGQIKRESWCEAVKLLTTEYWMPNWPPKASKL